MKVIFFLLAIVGLSQGAAIIQPVEHLPIRDNRDLASDLRDFLDLIPTDDILDIVVANLGDPEFQAVLVYIFSAEFHGLINDIGDIPEYEAVIAYLEGAGLPARDWIQAFKDFIGMARNGHATKRSQRGLSDIIGEIIAILPTEEIRALFDDKMQNSPAFIELVGKITGPEFRSLVEQVAANPETKRIADILRSWGIDLDAIIELIKGVFGWNRSMLRNSRDLASDLRDFLDLIPTDDILDIVVANLGDPEFQAVLVYIFSAEFHGLINDIGAIPEYEAVIAYLESAGLPARDWIQAFKDFIGMARNGHATKRSQRGLSNIIGEIIAILPTEEIRALFDDKMQNSPAFIELVGKITGPEFRSLVEQVAANPETKRIADILRSWGIDLDAIIELIKGVFGWNRSMLRNSRDLASDLRDFLDLIPTDDILDIVVANLGDPEFQAVLVYIFSAEFHGLINDIGAIPEYEAVIAYLEGAGLPAREWIQAFKDFIGMARNGHATKRSQRGLSNIIGEIIAILPTEEIRALFDDKMQNSPAFIELVGKITGPEFRSLVEQVAANPETKRIADILRSWGIDLDAIIELIKGVFGWNRSMLRNSRDLASDLRDFLDLIPTDDILDIVVANLGDPEFQAVLVYIFSAEFHGLINDIGDIPEYEAVIAYLEGAGLPARDWIQAFKDFIGMARNGHATKRSQRGLSNIIGEIIAILPTEEIRALFDDKMQNSPAFIELVGKITGPEFRSLVEQVAANPETKRIADILRSWGIDLDAIIELIKGVFGWN